ncbi:MAG: magnesium and cobalt transport protein CorA, partial [Actinobacteria bacterium]|nr:magnesium and cobalt transport protein CorA [Actinomycetota bacterium]
MATGPANTAGIDGRIGDCGLYEHGRRRAGRIPLGEAGNAARKADDGFVWIGLQQPTADDLGELAEEFGLPALAVEDAVKAHQRPKLEVYGDVLFVVLKPVRYIDHDEIVEIAEIALFLGDGFVVTVRHGESDVLRRVRQELDAGSPLLELGPTAVLYRAADLVVDAYEQTIELMNEDVDEIELQVFGADEQNHAERIYKLKREIAEFRRAVLPLAPAVARLSEGPVPHVDPAASTYFRDVHDHLLRAADAIEGHDRLLFDVLQADLARLSVRQSEIGVRQNEDMR